MLNFVNLVDRVRRLIPTRRASAFETSSRYWLDRYQAGGNSGAGSYNHLAEFKAGVINGLVCDRALGSVIEFGCGDGNQLRYATYPNYIGIDISPLAIKKCETRFASDLTKRFVLLADYAGERADISLSLDVIYHLVEDDVFSEHMSHVFGSADRFVVIYSSNDTQPSLQSPPHVRHRRFSDWVEKNAPDWRLEKRIQNPFPYDGDHNRTTFADFYIYSKSTPAGEAGA